MGSPFHRLCAGNAPLRRDSRGALFRLLYGATFRFVHTIVRTESVVSARSRSRDCGRSRCLDGDDLPPLPDSASLVHVDPFDFRAAGPGFVCALELVTCLGAASTATLAWYGLRSPSAAHELFHEVTIAAPAARAWCAELRVGGRRADAAGIGPGCGVLFSAADLVLVGSMRRAADAYVRAFNEQSVAANAGVPAWCCDSPAAGCCW
jgi:hypothetical protein